MLFRSRPAIIALDAPQGLPGVGRTRRAADAQARTPTSALPADRTALATWKAYRAFIEAGIEIFWAVHKSGGSVDGLGAGTGPLFCETYPRYVLRRLWPELEIPSKRKAPLAYVDAVWSRLKAAGFSCDSTLRPCLDHVDAMLCALAAERSVDDLPPGTVGDPPVVDADERVIREGYIVAP